MSITAKNIASVLGGTKSLGKRISTMRELEALVASGLPKSALDTLVDGFGEHYSGQSANDMRSQIVPRATYRRVDRFNLQASETIERIARLYAMALSVFLEAPAATRFMMRAHPELEQRSPFETALTELGGRAVEEVIERGMHGLPV
jgi:putative toxin-antitoxin system antitoxin component (TIGR02293 family)